MKKYVYLLGDYSEYGSENLVATLNRADLPRMLEENWPDEEAHRELSRYLEKTDEDLASEQSLECNLSWGGVQLIVVKLP